MMLPVSDMAIETIHILCSSHKRQKDYLPDIHVSANQMSDDFRKYIRHLIVQRPHIKQCKPLTFILHGLSNTKHDLELLEELCQLFGNGQYVRIEDSSLIIPHKINQHNIEYVLESDCSDRFGLERINISAYKEYKNITVHCTINAENQDYYQAHDYIRSYLPNAKIEFSICHNEFYLPEDTAKFEVSISRVCDAVAHALANGEISPFEESIVSEAMIRYNEMHHMQTYDLYPNCGLFHRSITIDLAGNFYLCYRIHQGFAPVNTKHTYLLQAADQLMTESYQQKANRCAQCEYLPLCRGACPFSVGNKLCKMQKIYYGAVMSILDNVMAQRTEIEL